ncbi:MAG: hypothetical protein ABI406_13500 [Ktedonobacteraceae bacterium]
MAKKTRLLLIVALSFSILLLLPAVSFAASLHVMVTKPLSSAKPQPLYDVAFTGLINNGEGKGAVITGGLAFLIGRTGKFTSTFKETNRVQLPVKGQIGSNASLTITFFKADNPYLTGQGTINMTTNEATGVFQILSNGKQVASGIWSWLPTDQNPSIGLAFGGHTLQGPDKGMQINGAITLDNSTLMGNLNLPDGTIIPTSATIDGSGNINVFFDLGNGFFISALGHPITNGIEKGYAGAYGGPQKGDQGKWRAYFFSF